MPSSKGWSLCQKGHSDYDSDSWATPGLRGLQLWLHVSGCCKDAAGVLSTVTLEMYHRCWCVIWQYRWWWWWWWWQWRSRGRTRGTPFPKYFVGEHSSPKWYQDKRERWYSSFPPSGLAKKCKVNDKLILTKIIEITPPDKGGEGKGRKREGKGMKFKGAEEDFRAFPQFQICH